ncbi:FUSC family protein [Falsibacillus albus]|uniref:Aromatic acid exporter family protein n=1 Tax=Falsibacillus albus TaxID=2478915 RepID=A0A3L7JVA4_9BACI|nr:aromatic acid exporter family protein [Falsibacillus albus]RLQ92362.1 aromatic acid exporter family protein [Falsibacillus albus]
MKLGARIFKTGIAIVLALFVAEILHLPSPVFAGIAAIFAVQPTIYRSYLSIIEQVQANLIGAILAVAIVLLFGNHVIFVGLAAIIAITIILKLKIENTIGLSLVTMISIMEAPGENFIQFAIIRFSTIMLGVFSSFIVNLIFLPPKYETKLFSRVSNVTEDMLKWIRLSTRHATENHLLKKDMEKIKERLIKIDQIYLHFKEERSYFKMNHIAKNRKLVIYRQMISTLRRAFEILKRLHRFENDIHQLPEEILQLIQGQLDGLMSYHEQLLLKFVGKVKADIEFDSVHNVCAQRNELLKVFIKRMREYDLQEEIQSFHFMHLLSSILEYNEHLEHLEKLIASFQSYHVEENEVLVEDDDD